MTVVDTVSRFLEETPRTVIHSTCELCGGDWLVTISNKDRYGLKVRFTMCRQCGLVSQNPRLGQDAYNRFYSEFYRPLLREFKGKKPAPVGIFNAGQVFAKMARITELDRYLPPSPRVLDIGGSSGVLADFIRDEYNAEVVIVEPNAVEAEAARTKGFEVHTEVLETANLDPASFNLVVMLRTVDHLIDVSAAFAKIRQILKPGGIFLVDGVDYFRRMASMGDTVKPLKIDHCYYFSPETLNLMMRKNGLPCLISDLAGQSASMVNLAQAGQPEEVSAKGLEMLPGCELRFHEWEQLANRSRQRVMPGYPTRSMLAELRWLGRRIFKGTK